MIWSRCVNPIPGLMQVRSDKTHSAHVAPAPVFWSSWSKSKAKTWTRVFIYHFLTYVSTTRSKTELLGSKLANECAKRVAAGVHVLDIAVCLNLVATHPGLGRTLAHGQSTCACFRCNRRQGPVVKQKMTKKMWSSRFLAKARSRVSFARFRAFVDAPAPVVLATYFGAGFRQGGSQKTKKASPHRCSSRDPWSGRRRLPEVVSIRARPPFARPFHCV